VEHLYFLPPLEKIESYSPLFGKKPVPLDDWEEFKEDLKYFVK